MATVRSCVWSQGHDRLRRLAAGTHTARGVMHCCRPRRRYAAGSSKSLSLVTSGRLYIPVRFANWLHVPQPENTEEEAKRAKKDGDELRALVKEYSQQAMKFADLATCPDWNWLLG